MAIDISTDYVSWDNTESVKCTAHEDGEPLKEVTVANALRVSPTNKFSSFSGVKTNSKQTTFWLPIALFGTKQPDMNMIIKDSDNVKYNVSSDARKIAYGTSVSHWDVLVTQQIEEC
jgi:hypothetical protein